MIWLQNRCVNMIAHLFNAPLGESETAMGVGTVGSSEAIMLAGLAFKRKWQNRMKAQGKPFDKPNIVTGANVQVLLLLTLSFLWAPPPYLFWTIMSVGSLSPENSRSRLIGSLLLHSPTTVLNSPQNTLLTPFYYKTNVFLSPWVSLSFYFLNIFLFSSTIKVKLYYLVRLSTSRQSGKERIINMIV